MRISKSNSESHHPRHVYFYLRSFIPISLTGSGTRRYGNLYHGARHVLLGSVVEINAMARYVQDI